jgi:CRP-like cAMP-binding protein
MSVEHRTARRASNHVSKSVGNLERRSHKPKCSGSAASDEGLPYVSDARELLLASRAFSSASDATIERLSIMMAPRKYPQGACLFWEGDEPGPAYLIETGRVRLTGNTANGRKYVIDDLYPLELVGEMSALAETHRITTACALDDVVAWRLPIAALEHCLLRDPELTLGMLRVYMEAIQQRDLQSNMELSRSVKARVAHKLLAVMAKAKSSMVIQIKQTELASMVGASRESVGRAVAELRAVSLVETTRGRIIVRDKPRLARIANPL